MTLTLTEIRDWVKEIAQVSTGPNGGAAAHVLEDELFLAVLKAIAAGAADPAKLAAGALEASALVFDRWYE